ncbi:hypothetical protein GCM10010400_19230 [Streptomyces aculeolatus]|uniref:wHTH domain-containing protein n=1 Tax=Streptomyces aculeolatus TaxID=270689 RepID=UPI001CEC23E2|nr:hypothetical protein [Streptomyces aculeolatus]
MGRGEPIDRGKWPESGAHRKLLEFLDRVHAGNGLKSRRDITAAMNLESPSYVNDMLRGMRLPVDDRQVTALVRALGGGTDEAANGRRLLDRARAEERAVERGEKRSRPQSGTQHPWARCVAEHAAWNLVDGDLDTADLREQSVSVAERLAALSAEAERTLAGDPWLDTDLADRFARRADWLVRTTWEDTPDLSPAEAALLALVPLLHHTHMARTLAALHEIRPLELGVADHAEAPRRDFEAFCNGHQELVERAQAPALPDRDSAGPEIGWWLFRRWAARFPDAYRLGAIRRLLQDADVTDPRMRDEVLEAKTVQRFLAGLRLDPAELADTDRQHTPQPVNVLFAGEPDQQRVRELLLSHLLAVAYAVAIDVIRLPDIVVRHLGIPSAVELDRLRDTVTSRAKWVLQSDCLVLRTDCHHPAELEGLRQYARQVDTLLHAVRRVCADRPAMEMLTRLPSRASADDVRPDIDEDGRPLFQHVSRFRLDERRVQGLLMGEQLYKDRGLAVRELYQNALDACRWRRARLAYRRQRGDWPDDWNGRIHFVQGLDHDGRAYLECRDNGIGMTEAVLTEVFAQAGVRFTDLTEFLVESAEWKGAATQVPFYPNSRFGIGVLSYFMIADEIEVVTRPLERGNRPHPAMKVSIFGPGHLFRIEHLPEGRSPGTSVKLYLRDAEQAPSCVEELRQLLGVAEFETVAEHGTQRERWDPGVLNPRVRPAWQPDGLDAHGTLVPWQDEQGDGQVVWCEHGGGLLVDGLYVRPSVRNGVFAGFRDGILRGAVVNLTRRNTPDRLSVDRRQVLSDVSANVEELLSAATGALMTDGQELLDVRWVSAVTEASPRLGDLVTEAAIEAGASFRTRTGEIEVREVGCFLQDSHLVLEGDEHAHGPASDDVPNNLWNWDFGDKPPDQVLVWRLIAHGVRTDLDALGVETTGPVRPALPTDTLLLGAVRDGFDAGDRLHVSSWLWDDTELRNRPGHILWTAMHTGGSPREVARRAVDLGCHEIVPEHFSAAAQVDRIDLALLSRGRNGLPGWLDLTDPVPVGHLLAVALEYGIGLSEGQGRLEGYGFRLTSRPRTESFSAADLPLLSWSVIDTAGGDHYEWYEWLGSDSIPASHVVRVAGQTGLPIPQVCDRLADFGLRTERLSLPDAPRADDLVLFDWKPTYNEQADHRLPVAYRHLVRAATELDMPLPEVAERLAAYGVVVPERLPDRPEADDLNLLSYFHPQAASGEAGGERVHLPQLLVMSSRAEVEPSRAAERLAEYGIEVPPGELPPGIDNLTRRMMSRDFDDMGPWLDESATIPRAHFAFALVEFGVAPRAAAERLAGCGLRVPTDLPEHPDHDDIRLLYHLGEKTEVSRLALDVAVPLLHLLDSARETRFTVREAAARLRWLGATVPDVDQVVADALARLPRP